MDFLTAYAIYMTVAILVVGMWAMRVPHENVGTVFILALVWPFTVVAVGFMMLVTVTGYSFDVDTDAGKMYNFRRPSNPKAKGFGLCLLGVEFRLYKMVD